MNKLHTELFILESDMRVSQQSQYATHDPIRGRALSGNAEGPMELLSTILGSWRSSQSNKHLSM